MIAKTILVVGAVFLALSLFLFTIYITGYTFGLGFWKAFGQTIEIEEE